MPARSADVDLGDLQLALAARGGDLDLLAALLTEQRLAHRILVGELGLGGLVPTNGDWPGIAQEVQRLRFLIFGLILVLTMLLRPQGLIPSRVRQQELQKGSPEDQTLEDVNAETAT